MVIHAKSKRRISYGDVVKFAKVPAELPKIAEGDLKKPSQFKLIGRKDIKRVDVPSKVNGTAKVRHRRSGAGHGLRLAAARADGRREGRERQRRRRQEDQGRHPRAVAAVRRGGGGRHGRGEPRRPHRAQGQVGHERSQGRAVRLREGQGGVRPQGQGPERRGRRKRSRPAMPTRRSPAPPRRWRRCTGPSTPITPRWSR